MQSNQSPSGYATKEVAAFWSSSKMLGRISLKTEREALSVVQKTTRLLPLTSSAASQFCHPRRTRRHRKPTALFYRRRGVGYSGSIGERRHPIIKIRLTTRIIVDRSLGASSFISPTPPPMGHPCHITFILFLPTPWSVTIALDIAVESPIITTEQAGIGF